MGFLSDLIYGAGARAKQTLGLKDVDLIPGDVSKKMTGVPASTVYGYQGQQTKPVTGPTTFTYGPTLNSLGLLKTIGCCRRYFNNSTPTS